METIAIDESAQWRAIERGAGQIDRRTMRKLSRKYVLVGFHVFRSRPDYIGQKIARRFAKQRLADQRIDSHRRRRARDRFDDPSIEKR